MRRFISVELPAAHHVLGADPVLRFLALLEWVDEAKVAELRAERAAKAAPEAGRAKVTEARGRA